MDDLAVFGGAPLFDAPRPIGQLHAPDRDRFLDRLDAILADRDFSGDGAIVRALEERLAAAHGVDHAIAFVNASVALVFLVRACAGAAPRDVLIPSFTYRGLPHIARWAGHRPRFCDVDETTHTLGAAGLRAACAAHDVGAILAVNNVNAPADRDGLPALAAEIGASLIYDSVDALGARWRGAPFGGGGAAEVFSLHATKLLNGFEGGYATTNDGALAATLRAMRDGRGPALDGDARAFGMNARLNTIHAAMALGSLEGLDAILERNAAICAAYRAGLAALSDQALLDPAPGYAPNGKMALLDMAAVGDALPSRAALLRILNAEGALARPYLSPPLHRSAHRPPDLPVPVLPITDRLAERFIQLPHGALTTDGDVASICALLSFLSANRRAIDAKL